MKSNWTVVEKSFFEKIGTKTCDIIQKNALSFLSYDLLYLNIVDVY